MHVAMFTASVLMSALPLKSVKEKGDEEIAGGQVGICDTASTVNATVKCRSGVHQGSL